MRSGWLDGMPKRKVNARASAEELVRSLDGSLPDGPTDPAVVVDELAVGAEPGLVAAPSGRFFDFVIGGTLPAALAADWPHINLPAPLSPGSGRGAERSCSRRCAGPPPGVRVRAGLIVRWMPSSTIQLQ